MTIQPSPLLTSAQRDQFTRFPEVDERSLSRHDLLDSADLLLVRERRRDFNKLGFAVQLTVLRHLGRASRSGETPPEVVLASLAEQLRVDPACYAQYAVRETTRREHFAALCQRLGYCELSRRQGVELRDWLMPLAKETEETAWSAGTPALPGATASLRWKGLLLLQDRHRQAPGIGEGGLIGSFAESRESEAVLLLPLEGGGWVGVNG